MNIELILILSVLEAVLVYGGLYEVWKLKGKKEELHKIISRTREQIDKILIDSQKVGSQ